MTKTAQETLCFARFEDGDGPAWGRVDGRYVQKLKEAPWVSQEASGRPLKLGELKLLAPARPGKVVCVGLNYRDHAEEMKEGLPREPKIFLKPPSSVADPDQAVLLPPQSARVDHEAELALVVGRRVRPGEKASGALFGYTCANDVTARDLQKIDGQWTRAKGFDTFCPLGPVLVAGLDASNLAVYCRVNGKVRQKSNTAHMIFPPQKILEFVSSVMTLEPGDLILTGTPSGIAPVEEGDVMEVEIEGIGVLKNPVKARSR